MLKKISKTAMLQAINTLLPFIIIPYYVRTIGLEGYGQIGVAISILQYLLLCAEYGFQLPSGRSIAQSKDKKSEASKIFANTSLVKIAIMFFGILFINILNNIIGVSKELQGLIAIGYLMVVGQLMTPSWIFLGRERVDLYLIFVITPRILIIPAIIFYINQDSDLMLAMLLQVMPNIVTAILTTYWAIKKDWISLVMPNFKEMKVQAFIAWPFFISSFATSFYTLSTPIILNSLCGAYSVGVYLIADKVRQGFLAILTPISLVVYPKVSREFLVSVKDTYLIINKISKLILIGFIFISIIGFIFSDYIIIKIFGDNATNSVSVLRILSMSTIFTSINTILGTFILVPLGAEKLLSKVLIFSGFFHLICTTVLVAIFNYKGAAFGVFFTELLMVSLMVFFLMRKDIKMNKCCYKKSVFKGLLSA